MSLPVDLNTITVTGSFPNIAGQPQSGSVVFDPGGQVTDTVGHVIMSGAVTAHVFNGVMQAVTLPCTDNGNLNPTGFTYEVTATIDGTKYTPFAVLLPHTLGATVDLAVLVPVSSNPGTSTVYGVLALPNTWTGVNTFTAETVVPTPVNSGDAATKAYVDGHSGAVSSVFTRTGAVVAASGDYTVGQVTGAAPLASPALTGSPTAPTQTVGDNTTKVATDAFVTAAVGVETTRAQTAEGLALAKASNLSDLGNAATARTNLGLGSAATQASSVFAQAANNLSDLASASTARTNLGLGSSAVAAIDSTAGDFQAVPGTAAAGATGKVADAGHVHPSPATFAPTGLTGATAVSRYVGATASGAPASGTFAVGDFVVDQGASAIWVCKFAGTPGTWKKLGQIDSTSTDIQPLGTQAAGSVGQTADAGHVHPTTGLMTLVATTGVTGYTMVNGTGNIVAWTAPSDGAMHRVMMFAEISVTSTETGGQVTNTLTFPDGTTASGKQVFAAAHATGTDYPLGASCPQFYLIGPGTTFTVKQNSALTGGASVVYAELWAS